MKKRPSWTPSALARIRDAGEKQFVEFLDEVSKEPSFPSVGLLPPVKGFRKGTGAGLAQQKKALANRFVSKGGVSATDRNKADAALYAFWKAWGRKHLGDPPQLSKSIDEIEEALDSDADGANGADAQIDGLFVALKDGSSENRCSREQIAKFFLFSPFDSSPKIEGAIAGAKAAKDVNRDISLYGLPERLHQDEEDLRGLKDQVSSLASQLDVVAADILELQAQRPDKDQESEAFDPVRLSAQMDRLAHDGDALSQAVKDLRDAAQSSYEDDAVTRRLAEFDAIMRDFGGRISDAQERLEAAGKVASQQAARLEEVETLLLGAQHELSELRLYASVAGETTNISAVTMSPGNPSLAAERLTPVGATGLQSLISRDHAQSLLQENLSRLGLKNTAAEVAAREIVAASTSGCVVHFKGSLATAVARACAVTLAGEFAFRLPVPIGVITATEMDAVFRAAMGASPPAVPAIVLEGLNNAPIEAISDLLRDYVEGVTRPRSLFFTSLGSGPSTLPENPKLLELGPILDLDVLDWRLSMSAKPAIAAGQLVEALLNGEQRGDDREDNGVEDFLSALRKQSRRNPRLETTAIRHFMNLGLASASGTTSLQSAAYCWLVPLWRMNEVGVEQIEQATNSGRCDGAKEDPRLLLLLEDIKATQAGDFR